MDVNCKRQKVFWCSALGGNNLRMDVNCKNYVMSYVLRYLVTICGWM